MDRILLPSNALVILLGPAGCGKSTFARRYFRDTQIVSSDECRRLVSDDEANQEASPQAFEVFRTIIGARLSLGRLTVADATNLTPGSRAELCTLAAAHNTPVVVIVLDVPFASCLAQNEARSRNVRREIIEWHYELFREATQALPREGYTAIYSINPDLQDSLVIAQGRSQLSQSRRGLRAS